MQHSHSRHHKTTSNLLRINLKGTLRFSNEWPLEGAMYINLWQNSLGIPRIFFCVCKFLEILIVSDKAIHEAVRIHQILWIKPIRGFLFFIIYPNYTLKFGFKVYFNHIWRIHFQLKFWSLHFMMMLFVFWVLLHDYCLIFSPNLLQGANEHQGSYILLNRTHRKGKQTVQGQSFLCLCPLRVPEHWPEFTNVVYFKSVDYI